ncbi:MAG TPA: c-type cytochrome [Steroidobacteraceae bacterium]|nr:c-type cytochrome [Steroidobacteraceae bacterium]
MSHCDVVGVGCNRRERGVLQLVRCAGLMALLFSAGIPAREGGVPQDARIVRGEHIAQSICSACHVVSSQQEFPPLLIKPAPPFAEIANRPGTTIAGLQHFITHTHWDVHKLPMSMPDLMLTHDEADTVTRYIMSLRR